VEQNLPQIAVTISAAVTVRARLLVLTFFSAFCRSDPPFKIGREKGAHHE
jgi:hypothetical protein